MLAIITLPFRGESANIKGQNVPIVVGGYVLYITARVLAHPGDFYFVGISESDELVESGIVGVTG